MSYQHTERAIALPLEGGTKLVLVLFAFRACPTCGLCWLGTKRLMAETGLGETRIQKALRELRDGGLLKIHAYASGGRGRSTEYIVLPQHMELSTAPCGECRVRMKNPPRGEGFDKGGTEKPPATRGVSAKPPAPRGKTPWTGTDQQLVNNNSHASGPGQNLTGGVSDADLDPTPPTPQNSAQALQDVEDMVSGRKPTPTPNQAPTVTPGPDTAR